MNRITKTFFLELTEKDSKLNPGNQNETLPKLYAFSKIYKEISFLDEDFSNHTLHNHGFLEIFFYEKGKGALEIDNKKIQISAGDVFVINSGTIHRQYSTSEPLVYYNIALSNFTYKNFGPNSISNNPYEKIFLKNDNKILFSLLKKLENERRKKNVGYLHTYSVIYEVLNQILNSLSSCVKNSLEEKDSIIQKVRDYIVLNFKNELSIEELSKRFFVSKSHLSHTFKNKYGVSPIKYLMLMRLDFAKNLLTKTNKTVTEISLESGFSNSNYFSYYFSKTTGLSPSDFRNQERAKN